MGFGAPTLCLHTRRMETRENHPDPPWSKQPACNLPFNTNGMFVWRLRHFDLVYTFVPEQKRQHHSFRPSIGTALARGSFILTCPAIHPLFFCVCHPSPFERSSVTEGNSTKLLRSTPQTTRHKGNRQNRDRDTKNTQTPREQKTASNDPFLGSSVSQMFTRRDSQSDAPCTRKVKSRLKNKMKPRRYSQAQ